MYKTILVPIDLSHPEQGSKTLGIARQIGGEGSRVVALFVTADVPGYVTAELPNGLLEKNLTKSRAELEVLADKAAAETEIRSGHPPTKILECAEETGADLIVIASHRPGLRDYFLGSTAARVVRHAQCAVFVDR
jgi:nucleotide-binding universal stress UspA family protein